MRELKNKIRSFETFFSKNQDKHGQESLLIFPFEKYGKENGEHARGPLSNFPLKIAPGTWGKGEESKPRKKQAKQTNKRREEERVSRSRFFNGGGGRKNGALALIWWEGKGSKSIERDRGEVVSIETSVGRDLLACFACSIIVVPLERRR